MFQVFWRAGKVGRKSVTRVSADRSFWCAPLFSKVNGLRGDSDYYRPASEDSGDPPLPRPGAPTPPVLSYTSNLQVVHQRQLLGMPRLPSAKQIVKVKYHRPTRRSPEPTGPNQPTVKIQLVVSLVLTSSN